MGFGQVKLGLLHEILGRSTSARSSSATTPPTRATPSCWPSASRQSGREEQREQWLRAAARRDAAQRLLHDRARGRRRPDADRDPGRARRRRVGDQRPQVVHLQRLGGRLPHRDGRHQPRRPPLPGLLDDPRADRHAGRRHRPRRAHHGAPRPALRQVRERTPRSSTATCGCRSTTWSATRARGSGWPRCGSGPGRIHHCMRWLGQSRRAFDMLCERAVSRYSHGSLLAEKQMIQDWVADSMAEMTAARLMTLHAAWKMDRDGPRRGPGRDRHDQVLRGRRPLQRDRPRHPGPRRARLLHRPAARAHVPRRARGRASTTAPTRSTR